MRGISAAEHSEALKAAKIIADLEQVVSIRVEFPRYASQVGEAIGGLIAQDALRDLKVSDGGNGIREYTTNAANHLNYALRNRTTTSAS